MFVVFLSCNNFNDNLIIKTVANEDMIVFCDKNGETLM